MESLYLVLDLGSISVPFLYSFHPKLKLYNKFKSIALGILFTFIVFIPWDIIFTVNGFWGFNENYLIGVNLFHLPIEEWLFFICIPFACIFTHYVLILYFPKIKLNTYTTKIISYILILTLTIFILFNYDKWYTLVNFSMGILFTLIGLKCNIKLLQRFFLTFIVMLIPFFIVNGILTGTNIVDEVVWYNNLENLNYRLGTIPVEDTIYAFTMILTSLLGTEYFEENFSSK